MAVFIRAIMRAGAERGQRFTIIARESNAYAVEVKAAFNLETHTSGEMGEMVERIRVP